MKICVSTRNRLPSDARLPECDVAVFNFSALGEVDYESELSGRSNRFEEVARLSAASGCGVLCGCHTDSRGLKRRSVAVADKGRLLGITDMRRVLDGDFVRAGSGLGIYRISGYSIGLIVDSDLYFADDMAALSACGCNLVVAILREVADEIPPLIIRSYAYLYGVPVVMAAQGTAYFADVTGVIASSNQTLCTFETAARPACRLVTERRRGLAEREAGDY